MNPQVYGAELAWWLSRELAQEGVETSYPNSEDWGWFIEYIVDDHEYWLCCSNQDGFQNQWRVFLDCKAKGLFGRNKAPVASAMPLLNALNKVLEQCDGISNIVWSKEVA